jgi:hypothetical protein
MIISSLVVLAAAGLAETNHARLDESDKPRVHAMHDIFQKDARYAKLFSSAGLSEICGPASMTNVVLWLKDGRKPGFKNLFRRSCRLTADKNVVNDCMVRPGRSQDEFADVFQMFNLCHTDKRRGTTAIQLKHCAARVFRESGYGEGSEFILGWDADRKETRRAVTPKDLSLHVKAGHGVVLGFGWYDRSTYELHGGHFVALAGDDLGNANVFYVSNPGVDYSQAEPGTKGAFYSKMVLAPVPASASVDNGHLPLKGLWQTESLRKEGSQYVGVLEEIIVMLPGADLAAKQRR